MASPGQRDSTSLEGEAVAGGLAGGLLIAVTAVELVVVVDLAIRLFFLTESTRPAWMWDMPPFEMRFLGAVYLTAVAPTLLLLAWRRRSLVRLLSAVFLVFGSILLVVSLFYASRFRTDTWETWFWFGLYVVVPTHALYQLWVNRGPLPAVRTTGSRPERLVLIGVAAIVGLYGLALLAAPKPATSFWPWVVDELNGRLYSAAFLACAVGMAWLVGGGTWREWLAVGLIPTLLGACAIAGTIGLDLTLNRVDWTAPGPRLWLLAFAVLAAAGLVVLRHGAACMPGRGVESGRAEVGESVS